MLPELRTERLLLRELSPEDAPDIHRSMQSDYMWRQSAIEPADMSDPMGRIENYRKHRGPDDARRLYVYTARLNGEHIGSVSLQRSYHPAIAAIGLSVVEPQAGRGYATELARRILAFGFDEAGLNRIEADVATENRASQRVMEKIGMRREGVLRDCMFAQGRWWTEVKFAVLAREHIRQAA